MNEETSMKIKTILLQHDAESERTARLLMEAIKNDCQSYGELKQRTQDLIKSIRFDNAVSLADRIEYLVENEMNDLPLTDRSKEF